MAKSKGDDSVDSGNNEVELDWFKFETRYFLLFVAS